MLGLGKGWCVSGSVEASSHFRATYFPFWDGLLPILAGFHLNPKVCLEYYKPIETLVKHLSSEELNGELMRILAVSPALRVPAIEVYTPNPGVLLVEINVDLNTI